MMPAITHLNPVLGVDVHIIQPPGPVPPVPIPHPYVGIVFDPFDYVPIIGSTISIHGLPRAIAGTAGKAVPSHIPIGGVFVKPPGNEDEDFMGSSTVAFDGDAATYAFLPCLSCHDVGMIAPPRPNPKKKTKMKSMVLPTSVVMPIPAGPPVLIGGPPTISLMALGTRAGMAALGKGLKRLAKSKFVRKALDKFKKVRQKGFRNMKPGFLKCKVLRAEPVDSVTGEVVVDQQDFSIPGRIPIEWNRHYGSQSDRRGVCGYGWETPADARLVFDDDGSVVFHDGSGAPSYFESLPDSNTIMEPVDGGTLHRIEGYYVVRIKAGWDYYFPIPETAADEVIVSSIADLSRNVIHFIRGENGLNAIEDDSGRIIEIESRNGLICSMGLKYPDSSNLDPLLRLEYDDNDNLICVYDALDAPYRFRYDNHRLTAHTDRNGLSFYYEYDEYSSAGRCIHAWGDGRLYDYRFQFHDPEGRTEITDSLGHPWSIHYDRRYLITKEIDPLGGITQYEYDDAGRTTAVVDPDGNRTEYAYEERGNLIKLIRPDDNTVSTELNDRNKAVRTTDPNGADWQQEWDHRGLLTKQLSPLGAESRYEYDTQGQLTCIINPRAASTALSYDTYGNLTHLTDALGYITKFTYDRLGNVTLKIDPLGHRTRYDYDVKGRLTKAVLPSGATIACVYDAEDNLTQYHDENGAVTVLEYFGLGEVKRRLQPDGYAVEYHYDTEERLVGVTNQRGERYELKRDPLGRIIEEVDYWGQSRHYDYTDAGQLKESVDPLGQTIHYETDPLGRIRKKLLPNPVAPDELTSETFDYDANGNLVACENDAIRIERTYDSEGRMLEERQGDACVVTNVYDVNGNRLTRRTEVTLAAHHYTNIVHYRYDALDQAIAVETPGHDRLQLTRNGLGQVTQETLSQSIHRHTVYGLDGYLTAQLLTSTNGQLFEQRYQYDPAGNLLEKHDSVFGVDKYTYDPFGRITAHLDPDRQTKHWLNDPAGDRLMTKSRSQDAVDNLDWHREGTYDGVLYRFDRAGNLAERIDRNSALTLVWDASQRLVETTKSGSKTEYHYDSLGRRMNKDTPGIVTRFFWDGDTLLGDAMDPNEQDDTSISKRFREWIYYPETYEPLGMLEKYTTAAVEDTNCCAGTLYLYTNDPNGSPSLLLDPAGQVVWSAKYSAWGEVEKLRTNRVHNPIRLRGQYADEETDLSFNLHRYFDPLIGQFVSQDPLGLAGGTNNYAYAPNALGWADPIGLKCHQLPSFKKLTTDWLHIFERHLPNAPMAAGRDVFSGMSERGVRGLVRRAWPSAKIIKKQGDRLKLEAIDPKSGTRLHMWYNKATNLLETAYPQ